MQIFKTIYDINRIVTQYSPLKKIGYKPPAFSMETENRFGLSEKTDRYDLNFNGFWNIIAHSFLLGFSPSKRTLR